MQRLLGDFPSDNILKRAHMFMHVCAHLEVDGLTAVHVLPAPKRTLPMHAHEPPSSEHFMNGIGSHRQDCVCQTVNMCIRDS
jgi:hypothetical protein